MKIFIAFFLLAAANIFALDAEFRKIVDTTITDLKTKTSLSLLKGHVSVNVSSGNNDLDKQFAAAIVESFPNFTAKSDSVDEEYVYMMTARVFRNNDDTVAVTVTVTDYQNKKTIDRRIQIGSIENRVFTTIQYESAVSARNEFDAYLDSAFENVGLPQIANYTPKKPYDWSWLTNFFSRFSFSSIAGSFKLKEWEFYLVNIGLSFGRLDNSWFSAGAIFDNGIVISSDILRLHIYESDEDSVTFCVFPVEVSWDFLEFESFRLAVYDRLELLSYAAPSEEYEYITETRDLKWKPDNYIGLRIRRSFLRIIDFSLFTETDFKTVWLGISAGLGWFGD
jgi:hypothetical protein